MNLRPALRGWSVRGCASSPVTTARQDIYVERGGCTVWAFISCNDYLNLSGHPAIIKNGSPEALWRALTTTARRASRRLVTGNHPLYEELESRLARLKGTDAACVFGSGYLANTGIIPALAGPGDLVLVDELSHACINGGAALSGATVHRYRHCDVEELKTLLDEHRARHAHALIATDGVFSMDGDLAPLSELSAVAQRYDAWLLADDAHGLGVVGRGRGSVFANGPADVPLQMGTLSRAIGGYGGYLCAAQPVIDPDANTRALVHLFHRTAAAGGRRGNRGARSLIVNEPEYVEGPLKKARSFTALNLRRGAKRHRAGHHRRYRCDAHRLADARR